PATWHRACLDAARTRGGKTQGPPFGRAGRRRALLRQGRFSADSQRPGPHARPGRSGPTAGGGACGRSIRGGVGAGTGGVGGGVTSAGKLVRTEGPRRS